MALWWGFVAASSLLIGGLIALRLPIPRLALGLIMAFGGGVLTSAVAYELVGEAFETSPAGVAVGMLAGALVYFAGDALIDRWGGHNRKRSSALPATSAAPAIVLGIVLDGIPESVVLGLTVLTSGAVSLAVLAAVFLSNLPEAVAATVGLRARGWSPVAVMGLWTGVAAASALASYIGYTLFDTAGPGTLAFVNAFAGGAILTMLADTMAPEAFEHGGRFAGLATTVGFLTAFLLTALT